MGKEFINGYSLLVSQQMYNDVKNHPDCTDAQLDRLHIIEPMKIEAEYKKAAFTENKEWQKHNDNIMLKALKNG
jgi:hypothetical protein